MTQRWATFDCYGTLIDWNAGIAAALSALLPGVARGDLLHAYHRIEPTLQAGAGTPYRDVLAAAARAVASAFDVVLPDGAERALPDSLPSWPPFAEVPAALATLREHGWHLGVLSNTDPDLLASSLAAIGVPVDATITVADAGSYKPAHGHWETFFAQSGAPRAHHVHVAASLFHDVEPCAALGLRCVWINRLGERTTTPHLAELPDLTDLPATLASLVPPVA